MEEIRKLLRENRIEEAIGKLDAMLEQEPTSDEAFYLRGNAYRKLGDFQQALNNYLSALELNPDSPAREAHDMLMEILDFYYKEKEKRPRLKPEALYL